MRVLLGYLIFIEIPFESRRVMLQIGLFTCRALHVERASRTWSRESCLYQFSNRFFAEADR